MQYLPFLLRFDSNDGHCMFNVKKPASERVFCNQRRMCSNNELSMKEHPRERLTDIRYATYRDRVGNLIVLPLYKLGKSDSDGTVYLLCRTYPKRVRLCVTRLVFERLSTSMDEARHSLSTPMPWKLREVLDPDILNLVQ